MLLIDDPKRRKQEKQDEQEGLVFSLDEESADSSSIVVEVPTLNQPLYYGAGDISDPNERAILVTALANDIIVEFENGRITHVPLHTSGRIEAKIYQFGDERHSWLYKRSEKTGLTIRPIPIDEAEG